MTSASENTIGDQRDRCGQMRPVDAGEHDLGTRGELLDERGDEDAVTVILVDESVAVDVVVHRRTDRLHAGCGGEIVGRRVDDQHAPSATAAGSWVVRRDRVVARPERVVRQGRLEVVEIGAEPSALQGGDDLPEERLAEDAGPEAEGRGERVQRCHAVDGAVEAPAHLGDGRVQPSGIGRRDEQLVRHRHDRRESPTSAELQHGEQACLAEAAEDRRLGDQLRIEDAVAAAVVQLVLVQRPERPAGRGRRCPGLRPQTDCCGGGRQRKHCDKDRSPTVGCGGHGSPLPPSLRLLRH